MMTTLSTVLFSTAAIAAAMSIVLMLRSHEADVRALKVQYQQLTAHQPYGRQVPQPINLAKSFRASRPALSRRALNWPEYALAWPSLAA
jgi:hypothetical protein